MQEEGTEMKILLFVPLLVWSIVMYNKCRDNDDTGWYVIGCLFWAGIGIVCGSK